MSGTMGGKWGELARALKSGGGGFPSREGGSQSRKGGLGGAGRWWGGLG